MRRIPLCVLPLFAIAIEAEAQVLITEVQPNPTGNDTAEWVELHNIGTAAVDISGHTISDNGGTPRMYAFPAGTAINPGQVIIVTAQSAAFTAMAIADGFAITVADYELAISNDDPNVPNLTSVSGTTNFGLNNGGDAVLFATMAGTFVDGMEYGNIDRLDIPGTPQATLPQSGESLRRVSASGSSNVDFQVGAPTPGVGFVPAANIPPAITDTETIPRHIFAGTPLTVRSTVLDADPVTVTLYSAIATSSAGPAGAMYIASTMTASTGNTYVGSSNPIIIAPMTFHDVYHRFYVSASDGTDTTTDPAMATPDAANTAYYDRNIMPLAPSTITEARLQGADEIPIYRYHSVTIEGIALTDGVAFVNNFTNFFIHSPVSNDAIRIFSRAAIPENVVRGDVVRVTGMIDIFRGLRQVGESAANAPDTDVTILSSGTFIPESTRTIAELLTFAEDLESQLVRVNGLTLAGMPATWPSNGTVDVTDGTGTLRVFVSSITDVAGAAAPQGVFDMRAIFSQNDPSGMGGYQLQPRDLNDILAATPPVDAGIDDSGFDPDGGDSGVDPGDAGDEDSGMMDPDTGVPDPDSGMDMDTGVPPDDSGVVPPDSGVVPPDSGVVPPDSGVVVADGGNPGADGGPVRMDAGTGGAGGGGRDDSGCGCSSTDTPNTTASSALALALLGLAMITRKKR